MLVVLAALPVQSALAVSTSVRLDNLERKLDSRGLQDMLNRIEQLQQDLQELRGDLEVQDKQMQDMQRRQREQYLDLDRRLQQLENPTGVPDAAGGVASKPPPMTTAPVTVPPLKSPPVTPVPGSPTCSR